jgi:hypothetical protein
LDVSFETRLPMASLQRELHEFFVTRQGLTYREEAGGVLSFSGDGGDVRIVLRATDGGGVRVAASTDTLADILSAFRARVAPEPGAFRRRRRLAAGDDLQRYRRLSERQPAPPASTQAQQQSFGGGLYPG